MLFQWASPAKRSILNLKARVQVLFFYRDSRTTSIINTNAKKLRKINHIEAEEPFINRELSWLAFNQRVLEESRRARTPLLERFRFLSICYSNLDEFFMVRMAGKKRRLRQGDSDRQLEPSHPQKILELIYKRCHEQVDFLYEMFQLQLKPHLEAEGIKFATVGELSDAQRQVLNKYYQQSVLPVLTPLAVDPAHPFPFLANRRLYLLVVFKSVKKEKESPPIAFVEVPSILPRLVPIPHSGPGHTFVFLEDLLREHLGSLFFGVPVQAAFPLRITRNLDITLLESEVIDLMSSIQSEVKAREQAEIVRLELSFGLPAEIKQFLFRRFALEEHDVFEIQGPLALADVVPQLYDLPGEGWRFEPFNPRIPPRLKGSRSIFNVVREADLILHHPYDSFYVVIELLHTAAWDPNVLAIKQTLYRTSGDSPIIDALIQAAEQGKQVTAVVELKARFDENNNILWARRMERAGVHVVYGFVGLKTHCKMTLIVRKEDNVLQRYVHLSTGNYNSSTARFYVDIGYMTTHAALADDISLLFNLLTGFNVNSRDESQLKPQLSPMQKLMVAPLYLRQNFLELIDREILAHQEEGQGHIMAKMNALVDPVLIDKLYEASQAGVKIQLIVRGICCLRPQIGGLSENIEVISIIGRFLEHSRIFYFHHRGQDEIFLGSADWMERNMDRRIEIVFPIESAEAKQRIFSEILLGYWRDSENSWQLNSDGAYSRREGIRPIWDCQRRFIEIAREQGIKSLPYDKAIRHNLKRQGRPFVKKRSNSKTSVAKDEK